MLIALCAISDVLYLFFEKLKKFKIKVKHYFKKGG